VRLLTSKARPLRGEKNEHRRRFAGNKERARLQLLGKGPGAEEKEGDGGDLSELLTQRGKIGGSVSKTLLQKSSLSLGPAERKRGPSLRAPERKKNFFLSLVSPGTSYVS